jgi:hypothetical protein
MSSQQPPIYYFFNIGFNSANWSSISQNGLSQGLADQYYLGRIGTPTSIATNTTFTGTTDINGIKTPTIESKSGTILCTSNLTLSSTTATVNNLICNNRIYQRSNLNTDIYSNASWMRQIQLLQATGAVLTPATIGYLFEYNILPQGSARYGTQTIPANSMLRGDIFKLTVQGRYAKGQAAYTISYRFYIVNNTSNVATLMGGFNDNVNSTVSEFYNIEVCIQLRTDPGAAGMVVGTFSIISGNVPQFLTNTGVPFNTLDPQTFAVTVTFSTLNAANLFATNFSNLQTM